MQLWQISEEVIYYSIRFDFKKIGIFQTAFLQPSYDNHSASVLKYAKCVSILLTAFNFVAHSF